MREQVIGYDIRSELWQMKSVDHRIWNSELAKANPPGKWIGPNSLLHESVLAIPRLELEISEFLLIAVTEAFVPRGGSRHPRALERIDITGKDWVKLGYEPADYFLQKTFLDGVESGPVEQLDVAVLSAKKLEHLVPEHSPWYAYGVYYASLEMLPKIIAALSGAKDRK